MTKTWLRTSLRKLGYDIHKFDATQPHRDCFADQRELLRGRHVTTIFDAGAHVGDVTSIYKQLFPLAQIFSFEPDPKTAAQLRTRFAGDSAVKVIQAALADRSGKLRLNINQSRATSSLFSPAPNVESYVDEQLLRLNEHVEVQAVTLEQFCSEQGIDWIALLKMDIQGAEVMALKGAANWLRSSRIDLIYCEVGFVRTYADQPLFHQLAAFLESYNYSLFNIYSPVCRDGRLLWGDAVFTSPLVTAAWESNHSAPGKR